MQMILACISNKSQSFNLGGGGGGIAFLSWDTHKTHKHKFEWKHHDVLVT